MKIRIRHSTARKVSNQPVQQQQQMPQQNLSPMDMVIHATTDYARAPLAD